jgi:hypothetical protein
MTTKTEATGDGAKSDNAVAAGSVNSEFEEAIRARLRQGFENWNRGYETWLQWCETLYEPDAHYNVYGRRLTLQEYKDMMCMFFAAFDVDLGDFYNLLVEDDWCGIRYSVHITNKKTGARTEQMTMEFVHFKDNPAPLGARVIEGWALSDKPLSLSAG